MGAWFQCESSADFRGVNGDGWCTRNSAVGLKGGFGNFFVGIWDTPFKRTIGNVGGRDTGIFGTADLLVNNSTSTTDGASPGVFKRRQRNSINYDSPNFGGFKVMARVLVDQQQQASTTTCSALAPSRVSGRWLVRTRPARWHCRLAGKALGAGWEQHTKFYAGGGDESAWHISGAYTLGNGLKLGATFTEQEADNAVASTSKNKAYQLGAEWKISGPHNVHFGYTVADDSKGIGATAGRPAAGVDTGAKLWQIRYLHDLSKRTTASIGYVNLKNDLNGTYDLMGVSGTGTGAKSSAVAMSLQHRF